MVLLEEESLHSLIDYALISWFSSRVSIGVTKNHLKSVVRHFQLCAGTIRVFGGECWCPNCSIQLWGGYKFPILAFFTHRYPELMGARYLHLVVEIGGLSEQHLLQASENTITTGE